MKNAAFAIALAALFTSLPSYARRGGEGGGGASECRGKLVDSYGGHSVHELPGFDAEAARLRQFVPTWVKNRVESMEQKNVFSSRVLSSRSRAKRPGSISKPAIPAISAEKKCSAMRTR